MFVLTLVLHIIALLFWGALLLYMPHAVMAQNNAFAVSDWQAGRAVVGDSLPRWLFTRVATPIALLAIAAGTLVFVLDRNTAPWLIIKLTLVSLLVIAHALIGAFILRVEAKNGPDASDGRLARWLIGGALLLMCGIVWLVLAKPRAGWLAELTP